MLLDDLVTAIQTVQARIREHGNSLSQNEYRTRISLIDPFLNALGWDVSDPGLVTVEYQAGNGRADYALLGLDSKPRAFVEAKRLNEPLDSHQDQVFKYTWDQKLFYGGLTDGNRWVLEDVTAAFSGREGRLLDISLSKETAHQCAIKLLALWHPVLATGQSINANDPVLVAKTDSEELASTPEPALRKPPPHISTTLPSPEWISLAEFNYEGNKPSSIRLPDGQERNIRAVIEVLKETAEWLVRIGELTKDKCPVRAIVNTEPRSEGGARYANFGNLSNGLFFNKGINGPTIIRYAVVLTEHFDQNPASIFLRSS